MAYRWLATAVLVAHFAYLGYVVFGGFLAWRWPRAIWPHLVAGGWGVLLVGFSLECPLTYAENWARRKAGEAGLGEAGFIDRYIEGVLYPERYAHLLQAAVAVLVVMSWLGAYLVHRKRQRDADTAAKTEDSSERPATV